MKRLFSILFCVLLLAGCSETTVSTNRELITSSSQLVGKKVGASVGSIYDDFVKDYFPNSKRVLFNTRTELLLALRSGKIEAFAIDDFIAYEFINQSDDLTLLNETFPSFDNAFVFSNDATNYLSEFNDYLKNCKANGYLDYLKDKWVTNFSEDTRVPEMYFYGNRGSINVITATDAVPMSFVADGSYQGYEVELFYSFCSYAGYTPNVQSANFDAIITAIASNKFDVGFTGITITDERKKSVNFSEPVYQGSPCVVVMKNINTTDNQVPGDVISNNNDDNLPNPQINNETDNNVVPNNQNIDNSNVVINNEDISVNNQNDTNPTVNKPLLSSTGFFADIVNKFNRMFFEEDRLLLIADGIRVTLLITLLSLIFGTLLGFALYLACRKANKHIKNIVNNISFIINRIPVIIILMFMFYIVFSNSNIEGVYVSIFGFTVIEIFSVYSMLNTGIDAIDKGQTEAALALGYTDNQALFKYVLPQALKIIMPSYKNDIVSLIKATSVVGYITVQDLTRVSDIIRSRTYEAFFPLFVSALIYFLLAWGLCLLVDVLQKKFLPNEKTKEEIINKYKQ